MGEKKKKGLGGLSKEKKKQLKALIMAKAAEDLKNEALKKKQERDKYISETVKKLELDGKSGADLKKKCNELQKHLEASHDSKYDLEQKLRAQDIEINELNMKVNDTKGKFMKPVLKKVSRTDAKFAKLDRKKAPKIEVELKRSATIDEPKAEEEAAAEEVEDEEEEEEE